MSIRRRTGLIFVGIAALLLFTLIFVGPALIKVDRYRPQVISYLQAKTGKQVEIARLGLTLFPLSIHINDFGVKNPPIFPRGYVAKVARIDAEPSVGALLHRQVVLAIRRRRRRIDNSHQVHLFQVAGNLVGFEKDGARCVGWQ